MDLEQQLRAALAPCEPGPEPEGVVMARVSAAAWRASRHTRRRPGRAILYGTILVAAAAAAMLALHLWSTPEPQPAIAMPVTPAAEPVAEVVEASVPAALDQPAPLPEKITPVALPPVKPFTVSVLPLRNEGADAAVRSAVDTFHAAMLDGLRAVPGLTLVEADPPGVAPDAPARFQLTFTGKGSAPRFVISTQVEAVEPDGRRRSVMSSSFTTEVAPACAGIPVDDMSCTDPASVAAYDIRLLRTRVFPPDASLRQQLQARLLDSTRDPRARLAALADLASWRTMSADGNAVRGEGIALRDPEVIRGAITLAAAATDPAQRAQVWRHMRFLVNSPDLRQALIDSSWQERDDDVRAEIVATLAQGFAADPVARPALAEIAREDARPLVRALAQRAVAGDAAWKDYILSSLKDTGRSDAERIEAMFYDMNMPTRVTAGSYSLDPSALKLLDDEGIRAFAAVLPRAARESPTIQRATVTLVSALGTIDHPAITKMLLDGVHGDGKGIDRFMAANQLASRSSDPEVRAALEKIATDDPDPRLRELVAKALNSQAGGSVGR